MFFKQGNITQDQLGVIELKQDCAFVAVPVSIAEELVEKLNNSRFKKKKVRVSRRISNLFARVLEIGR